MENQMLTFKTAVSMIVMNEDKDKIGSMDGTFC